uniref:Uncharacterized protein n=1 Tax=Marinobacter nauticus TaxID=2743 RepID=A0A455W4Z0_MARNT|nr:hypothetical protein YBY_22430 [Marinobacter nauticus]
MFRLQFKRIHDNVSPFILTGLFAGLAIGLSEYLRKMDWLVSYLDYASIDFDLADAAQKILDENLAPTTLVFLVVIIFTMSALHRIFFGAMEFEPKERKGIIFILENFASLLGIAWLAGISHRSPASLADCAGYRHYRSFAVVIESITTANER